MESLSRFRCMYRHQQHHQCLRSRRVPQQLWLSFIRHHQRSCCSIINNNPSFRNLYIVQRRNHHHYHPHSQQRNVVASLLHNHHLSGRYMTTTTNDDDDDKSPLTTATTTPLSNSTTSTTTAESVATTTGIEQENEEQDPGTTPSGSILPPELQEEPPLPHPEQPERMVLPIDDGRPIIRTPLLPPLPHQIATQYNHVIMSPTSDYTNYDPQSLAHFGRIGQQLEVFRDSVLQSSSSSTVVVESESESSSSRRRQRRRESEMSDDTVTDETDNENNNTRYNSDDEDDDDADRTTNTTTASRGQNSYLKINFFQRPYLEGLYNITSMIQGRLDQALQEHVASNGKPLQKLPNIYYSKKFRKTRTFKLEHTVPNTSGSKLKPSTIAEIKRKEQIIVPPLQIIPRPISKLHCLLFFGGTVWAGNECCDEELLYFYEKVTRRLHQSGFIPSNTTKLQPYVFVHLPDDYWFQVKEFKVFPPRGKYLIVAQLQASLAYHHLWNDINDIARNEMANFANRSNSVSQHTKSVIQSFMNTPAQKHINRWIPYITVANIEHAMDGKRVEEKILQKVLETMSDDQYDNEFADEIQNMKCHSISMGGPIPQLKKKVETKEEEMMVEADENGNDTKKKKRRKKKTKELLWDYNFQFVRRGVHYDKEEEWDDSIWSDEHDPDPFGHERKKWLKKKKKLILRGKLKPDDEYENDKNTNHDDDDDDEAPTITDADEYYDEHPQRHILKVFREQSSDQPRQRKGPV